MHEFIRFCEDAMCSPDTTMSFDALATRYEKHTGRPMTVERVAAMEADWRAYVRKMRGVIVGTIHL